MKAILVSALIMVCAGLSIAQETSSGSEQTYRDQAEAVIGQLPRQIKEMDEPTLRVLLRIRLAGFLRDRGAISTPRSSDIPEGITIEALVKDALEDFKSHKDEIPGVYVSTFRSELLALLRRLGPETEKRLADQYEILKEDVRDQLLSANEMFNSKGGSAAAIEFVQRLLSSGKDPGSSMVFLLQKIQQESPALMPDLITAMLTVGEQSGALSANLLYWTGSFFLASDIPLELKIRYLNLALNAVEREQPWVEPARAAQDYRLLNNILPAIQTLAPPLYQRAGSLMVLVTARVPTSLVDRVAAENRINQSSDKLNQMLTEITASKDDSIREDLAIQAAQIALTKKQTRTALELTLGASITGERVSWRDHFLGEIIGQALEEKDGPLAQEAASGILSVLDRAGALEKIGLYFYQAKDGTRAREVLNEAAKLVDASENGADKVRRSLLLASDFAKVDQIRVLDMMQIAVKAINSIPKPGHNEPPLSKIRVEYTRLLAQIAWNIMPALQRVVLLDELQTLALIKGIQNKEISAFATFGAATGILKARPASAAETGATRK